MISYDVNILAFKMFIGKWANTHGHELSHEIFNLDENDGKYYGLILNDGKDNNISLRRINPKAENLDKIENVLLVYFKDYDNDMIELIAYALNTTVYRQVQYGINNRILYNPVDKVNQEVGYHTVTDANNMHILNEKTIKINLKKQFPTLIKMFRAQRAFLDEPEDKTKTKDYQQFKRYIIDLINKQIDNIEIDYNFDEIISSEDTNIDNSKNEPKKIQIAEGEVVDKDQRISKQALKEANYKCEYNENHITFNTKQGIQYMEGHHLIRCTKKYSDKYWNNYKVNIDMTENIVSLCPNCHRMIHYGTDDVKTEILNTLFNKRKDKLINKGLLDFSLDKLKEIYEIKN